MTKDGILKLIDSLASRRRQRMMSLGTQVVQASRFSRGGDHEGFQVR
jgi:hypothetical protein